MFMIKYQGLRIAPSLSAMQELMREEKTLYDVVEILEQGYDSPRRRKPDVIERWLDVGDKTFNAVIGQSYDDVMKEDIWVLIHFGKFTRKKRK